ncbi:tyrosine-protein phosphatase [Microbispora bryophytorum]|uniref:tyrosine-protein phosphatase n=1 Tax=Microbispora bryophytorum TaxID=1460882 RepID=UPI0034032193
MVNFAENSRPSVEEFEGIDNIRDLGGMAAPSGSFIPAGRIFRSDALVGATEHDRDLLFGKLKVDLIIDLRTAAEAGGDGLEDRRLFPNVDSVRFSIVPEGRVGREPFPDGTDAVALAHEYLRMLSNGEAAVKSTLEAIADAFDSDRVVLYHCAAGRDRTGVVTAILASLMGIRRQEIVYDFLMTNMSYERVEAKLRTNPIYRSPETADRRTALLKPESIRDFLDLLRAENGGYEQWAERVGVSSRALHTLRGIPTDA